MKEAVINTSPLIFLSKLDMLDTLLIYKKIYTTKVVMDEIERGLEKGYQEALSVRKLVEKDFITVRRIKAKEGEFGLHPGELTVITLAKKMKVKEIIVDDRSAIRVAKYFGFNVVSTPFLLLKNLKMKRIDYEEFENAINRLIGEGYFISPNLYVKILEKAEEL